MYEYNFWDLDSNSGRSKRFFSSPNTSRFALGPTQPPTQWLPGAADMITKIMRKGYLYHQKCRPHALETNYMILEMHACFTKVTEIESI